MRMLDPQEKKSIRELQLYLSVREAKELVHELNGLLGDPESFDHSHVYSDDGSRQLSMSILTDLKLANSERYTPLERAVFDER